MSVLWEGTGRGLFSLLLSHKFPPLSFSLKKGSKFDGQPDMTPTSRQDQFFFSRKNISIAQLLLFFKFSPETGLTLGESLTCFEEGSAAAARFANIWLFSLPFLPPHLVLVKAKVLFIYVALFAGKGELGRMSMQRGEEKEKGERLHKMESKGHLRGKGERVKNGRLKTEGKQRQFMKREK